MVNHKLLIKGTVLYLTGFLGSLILGYIMVPLMDAMATFAGGADYDAPLQAIGWLGVIIVWILSTMVVPLAITIEALMEEQEGDTTKTPTMLSIAGGVLWALFTILIFYYVNRMGFITGLAAAIPTTANALLLDANGIAVDFTILLIIYWMAIVATVLVNTVIVPGYIIAKYRQ